MANVSLVVLDWIILGEDNKFTKEGKYSVMSMTSITAPRKEFSQYSVGEEVMAKFGGKKYRAEIMAIGTAGKK